MLQAILRRAKHRGDYSGQSLIETALLTPLVLLISFNALNFGYFFFVALHLTAAPRSGVEYSIQGFATPTERDLPSAGPSSTITTVSWLTYQDMAGLSSSVNATVRVCSKQLGVTGTGTGTSNCCVVTSFPGACSSGAGGFPAPAADPDPTHFVLNRVDVQYTVTPLVPVSLFGLTLTPSLTFHRQVSMRAMD